MLREKGVVLSSEMAWNVLVKPFLVPPVVEQISYNFVCCGDLVHSVTNPWNVMAKPETRIKDRVCCIQRVPRADRSRSNVHRG